VLASAIALEPKRADNPFALSDGDNRFRHLEAHAFDVVIVCCYSFTFPRIASLCPSLAVDPFGKRLLIQKQAGIVGAGIEKARDTVNFSKNKAGHRQRADADAAISFFQADDCACRYARALGKSLDGDTPFEPRSSQVGPELLEGPLRTRGANLNRHI
jgi:hypothetical protein